MVSSASNSTESEKTENRKVNNFDEVKVSAGIDLYLTMGDFKPVRVVSNEDDINDIITEVKGETLHIYRKNGGSFNIFNWRRIGPMKVYVTAPVLKNISASSGADVKSENTLRGEVLELNSSSGSHITLSVVYKEISLDSSSGSDIEIEGKAKSVQASASSGSQIRCRELEAMFCHAKGSSGANLSVYASDEIVAEASSGADIRYYGNPERNDINKSSGGGVSSR